MHLPLLEDVGGSGCKSGALLVQVIGIGVALGIGLVWTRFRTFSGNSGF